MILIINQNDFLADLQEYLNDQEAIALDINESNDYLINDKHQALRHRIGLSYEAEANNISADEVISEILDKIAVP